MKNITINNVTSKIVLFLNFIIILLLLLMELLYDIFKYLGHDKFDLIKSQILNQFVNSTDNVILICRGDCAKQIAKYKSQIRYVIIDSIKTKSLIQFITEKGITIRIPVNQISNVGRVTSGVRIIKLEDKDRVSSVAKISKE